MNLCRSGEELLRRALLIGKSSSLRKQCGSLAQSPVNNIFAFTSLRRGRPLSGCAKTGLRYYSHGETHGQALEGLASQPVSVQDPSSTVKPTPLHTSAHTKRQLSFYDMLQECSSPTDVLDLAGEHAYSHTQISNSLIRIWVTTKKMTEDQRRCELQLMFEHPVFEELCQRAVVDAHRMRNDDLAYSLLATIKLGVSHRSRVVQTLLRVVQENLNEFDEKPLSVLAACLEDMEGSPNVEALKEGFSLILEDRIPKIQRVVPLQTMMRMVGKKAPVELKKKLEQKALSMADDFTLPNAQYMITTLATMGLNSKPLLDICSKRIADNVHSVPFNRLLMVLKAFKELHYRSVVLLSSISEYVASTFDMWSNKQVVLLLLEFENLNFSPVKMLDVFADRVIQNPGALKLKDILSVLKVYSQFNHDLKASRQDFLDSVSSVLESYLPKIPPADLLKAVFCLCTMDHFPLAPLEKLLQREVLKELLDKDGQSHRGLRQKLHTVSLCLRLDDPPLPPDFPSLPDTFSLAPPELPVNPGLVSTLKSVVGDAVMEEGVVVENVYFIDCVVRLPAQTTEANSAGREESFSSEDIHTERIAVLCAPPTSFCFGSLHPRGNLALKLRHLRALQYRPVLVPVHELQAQTEEERTNVLKRLIFPENEELKKEGLSLSNNDGLRVE
ncbi:FAST kinase domain-containing protein 2, mitochondrial [Chanos chanos]|uniref:FAST kinase domain-containing protein 2, mitochondrial n=1 Tax=Chanos chanos TaxID=29144 RepID=A0A6J2VX81_CHACN|nr:FAST kinase domain-containing protein 2, mitochondrial [Chanos chanos]